MDHAAPAELPADSAFEVPRGRAALSGAVAAGLALGLTELAAGLTESVPSALSSVGGYVVDSAPPVVKDTAITVFGTADKGALAIGTVIIAVLIGAVIGPWAARRRWVGVAAFSGFALVGIAAAFSQPSYGAVATVITIAGAALAGWWCLDRLLAMLRKPPPMETPTDRSPGDDGRRRFMWTVGGIGIGAALSGVVGRSLIISRSEEVRGAMELPAATETVPPPGTDASFAVDGLVPVVVPNDQFYRIDTALVVPRPDPHTWTLTIDGMVERELVLTMADLLAMPLHEQYTTLSCVSNEVGGSLVGNAKWTGVRLVDLLERVGVQPGADQLVSHSVDGWNCGFPTELAFDGRDPLVAVGMNGELLPPAHGFPARLVVPGLYGYVSATKWLERIELATWDGFDGYWVPRGWSKEGPIKTQSRIDVPKRGADVAGAPTVLAGVAWAPLKGVERVEVRIGDGPWEVAALSSPLSDKSWVQWRHEVALEPGRWTATVRATDGTGYTQTDEVAPPAPDGATGWHSVDFATV